MQIDAFPDTQVDTQRDDSIMEEGDADDEVDEWGDDPIDVNLMPTQLDQDTFDEDHNMAISSAATKTTKVNTTDPENTVIDTTQDMTLFKSKALKHITPYSSDDNDDNDDNDDEDEGEEDNLQTQTETQTQTQTQSDSNMAAWEVDIDTAEEQQKWGIKASTTTKATTTTTSTSTTVKRVQKKHKVDDTDEVEDDDDMFQSSVTHTAATSGRSMHVRRMAIEDEED